METKTCRDCSEKKPLDQFPLRNGKPDTWCLACRKIYQQKSWAKRREHHSEWRKNWYKNNRQEHLNKCRERYQKRDKAELRFKGWKNKLKSLFNMTVEEYQMILEEQNNVCAICGEPEKIKKSDETQRLSVDHDHKTGKVRGLLCHACNTGLGKFKDSTELMQKAIAYIQSSN
jgi:hypothetical protein